MNIKKLAEQAGMSSTLGCFWQCGDKDLENFAALIRQDEAQACAKHYLKIMRDAVKEAREREREACAKVCEQIIKESEINYKKSEFEKQQRLLCLKMIEIPIKNAAAAIRARGNHE